MSQDRKWESIQRKTFTGWCNNHLRKRNLVIKEIENDFCDGLKLIALLEIISDEAFNFKFDKRPKMKIQKVNNVQHCLTFIKQHGVNLAGTGAEEIVDSNSKMILGMIWTIILRFAIQDISMEELSAKEALLLWCQKKTQGYDNVNVKNFHMSFQDGLAFCALIHKHRPDILDFNALDKSDKEGCLNAAFDAADKHLDVPKLLDATDLTEVAKPDERSVMTYVALLYHVFSSSQKAEAAGKRVGKLLDFAEANEKIISDYEGRAARLAQWTGQSDESMKQRDFDNTMEGVKNQISEFKSFRTEDKPPKYNEKVDLEALVNGLQTKLALNNRPAYNPPAGLSSSDIDGLWSALEKSENERASALREELRRQKRILDLLHKFNILAGKLEAWASDRNNLLASTEYGDSIASCTAKINNLNAFESEKSAQTDRVSNLKGIAGQLEQLGYGDMPAITNRVGGIDGSWDGLTAASSARRANLEAHLAELKKQEEMLLDFAKRGLEFRVFLEKAEDILTEPIVTDSVAGVKEMEVAYESIAGEHSGKAGEFAALETLASDCKSANLNENTYAEVSMDSLTGYWNKVSDLVLSRKQELASETQKQESDEELRLSYAGLANSFSAWCKEQSSAIESLSGEIQSQLDALQALNSTIVSGQGQFNDVLSANQLLDDNHVTDNQHTELSIEQLKSQYNSLQVLSEKKQKVLEKELLEQSGSGLSADQLAEFKECFKHFDKDEDLLLSRLELGACLKSLGEDLSFEEGGKLDHILKGIDQDGDGKVTFEEFASYMEQISSGSDTPDSVKQAFKALAGDKDFVTESDLRAVLPSEKVDYCLARMKPYSGGPEGSYDYNTFTDSLYGK